MKNSKKTHSLLRRKNLPVQKLRKKSAALKKQITTDRVIDFSVDVGIVAFDVLSSPILIVVRIVRFYIKKFINNYLKRFLKWFIHMVLRIK